jgi:hypothetical protein
LPGNAPADDRIQKGKANHSGSTKLGQLSAVTRTKCPRVRFLTPSVAVCPYRHNVIVKPGAQALFHIYRLDLSAIVGHSLPYEYGQRYGMIQHGADT